MTYRQLRFEPPAGALDLVLIRHGESEAYQDGRLFPLVGGQGDPPLSALGIEQARRVCARLAAEDVDAIYVTTLRRTAQTAARWPWRSACRSAWKPGSARCTWASGRVASSAR